MYEGNFKMDEVSFDVNELKTDNFYSIVGCVASGKTTALINLAISLCKNGNDVIYVNVESTDNYIVNKIKDKTSTDDIETMKQKFHFMNASYNMTLTYILNYIKTKFSSEVLSNTIIIIDDLYSLKNESNDDETLYNNLKIKVTQLRTFCIDNGMIPIVSVQAARTYNIDTMKNPYFEMVGNAENKMGIHPWSTKCHSKFLIRKTVNEC